MSRPVSEVPQFIVDRKGRRYTCSIVNAAPRVLIQLHHQQQLVGEVKCLRESSELLLLKDIAISNEAQPQFRSSWLSSLLQVTGWQPQPVNYRRLGLGSALLTRLIEYARSQGVQILRGEVYRPDVENNPKLLQWYQKHGFELNPPEPEDSQDIIARLEMHLV